MAETTQDIFKINPELTEINFKQVAEEAARLLKNERNDFQDDPENYRQYADKYAETEDYVSRREVEEEGIQISEIE